MRDEWVGEERRAWRKLLMEIAMEMAVMVVEEEIYEVEEEVEE